MKLFELYQRVALNRRHPFADHALRLAHHLHSMTSVLLDARQLLAGDMSWYHRYENDVTIRRLHLTVTNHCNADCVFCAYGQAEHEQGTMSMSTLRKTVDEYIALGGRSIAFAPLIGEILLDRNLFEKIAYVARIGRFQEIIAYTNGILLSHGDTYRKLIDSGITELHVSFAGPDKEMYQSIYRVNAYDALMAGIHKLLEYNRARKERTRIYLMLRPSISPSELMSKEDFRLRIEPYLSRRVTLSFKHDYDSWGGLIKPENLAGVMKMRRIPRYKWAPCRFTYVPCVLFDGSVRLCACRMGTSERDELVVGNIHQLPLRDLVHGAAAKRIRAKFVEKDLPPICEDCSMYLPVDRRYLRELRSNP